MTSTAMERLEAIGFCSIKERRIWLREHSQEIIDCVKAEGLVAAKKKYHVSPGTLRKLLTNDYQTVNNLSNMGPEEFAGAILDKYVRMRSDNMMLKQENMHLRNRVSYLESQAKLNDEKTRKEFSDKLAKVVAIYGD